MTTKLPKIKEKAENRSISVGSTKKIGIRYNRMATDGEVTKKEVKDADQRNQPRPE